MDENGGVRAGCIRIRYRSPRKIMARWFSSPRKVKGKKKAMAEGRVRDCDPVRIINFSEDGHGVCKISDSPPQTIDSGREEIHKIVELRNDLEKLLECKNDELRRKQQEFVNLRSDIEKFLECHNDQMGLKQQKLLFGAKQEQSETSPYSTTSDVVVDGPESSTDHYYSPQFLETSLSVGHEGSLKHYLFKGGEEMDQLEAELEAEFELLKISQDQESKCSKLNDISEQSEDSEGLMLREMMMCPGPMEERQGVCPYELERRLHELLETRQEEEIKELEFALEDAKLRLHSKEAEASWWKDTAYIISEHIPQPSRITSNSHSHRYPLSR